MSASFHVDVGPFVIDVQLDESGVQMQRGGFGPARTTDIAWEKITGATLVRPRKDDDSDREMQRAAQFLGEEAVQKLKELQGTVGQIFVAYHDEKNRVQQAEIPAPLNDAAYMQEFQTRLGKRWLGETADRQQVDKKLHTNPGFFKTIFILLVILGILAAVGVIALLGLLGPMLNFMSIEKMLIDLQDGNYASFASRLTSYVALFAIGYFLHRVIRTRLDAFKGGAFGRRRSPR
jgi:hypothetical protein